MSQFDWGTMDPAATSGIQLADKLNNFRNAINSAHKGSGRPSYVTAGMIWVKDSVSPWLIYMYDGSADVLIGKVGGASFTPENGVRTGAVLYFPATAAPAGFIKANGGLLSRTTYADLWAFASASGNLAGSDGAWQAGQFSPGDGSTTFRIPDLRGEAVRGWDDGRGIDSGRGIGTWQDSQNKSHNHGVNTGPMSADHGHTAWTDGQGAASGAFPSIYGDDSSSGEPQGVFSRGELINDNAGAATNPPWRTQYVNLNIGVHGHNVGVGSATATHSHAITADGGSETRVRNVAMLSCIKY